MIEFRPIPNPRKVELYDVLFKTSNSEKAWKLLDEAFKPDYPMNISYNTEFLTIEIPILEPNLDNVSISTKNDELTISKKDVSEPLRDVIYEKRGIVKRAFSHTWRINPKFDLGKITAEYKHGLLIVSIPYAEQPPVKNIPILDHSDNSRKVPSNIPLEGKTEE